MKLRRRASAATIDAARLAGNRIMKTYRTSDGDLRDAPSMRHEGSDIVRKSIQAYRKNLGG